MSYKLIVANIDNVVGAHIHVEAVGLNGPIVVPLFAAAAGGGRTSGVLIEGRITATNLTGPLSGDN